MKSFAATEISTYEMQDIMKYAIAPRPIALASTIDADGNINLSPFSFFNMFSAKPPILIFSPLRQGKDNPNKDTLHNILETKEVVVGIVNFDIVQQISLASAPFGRDVNEFEKVNLTTLEADLVKPKLIAECPVNFECKVLEVKPLGENGGAGNLVICEVLKVHVKDECFGENGKIDQVKLDLVARLGGDWYSRNNEQSLFKVPRPNNQNIGIDLLPTENKTSKVFTGNDLGMLANIDVLLEAEFSSDSEIHKKAQSYLLQNNIEEAWEVLKGK